MKYYMIICLIIKDENEYLEEWIDYHLGIGVDYIVIYDNNSHDPVDIFLKSYIDANKVEVHRCPIEEEPQLNVYNHCLYDFYGKARWIGFIDVDEFIVLNEDKDIKDFLKGYEQYGGVCLNWKVYNANGHVQKLNDTVMDRFTRPIAASEEINTHVKTILQPKFTRVIPNPHFAHYINGYFAVNELGVRVNQAYSEFSDLYAHLNHYYTRSYEEWVKKIIRGRPDLLASVKEDRFWKYNQDMLKVRDQTRSKYLYPYFPKYLDDMHTVSSKSNWTPLLEAGSFDEILQKIAFALTNSLRMLPWNGLTKGRMGIAIFLLSYLKGKSDQFIYNEAKSILNKALKITAPSNLNHINEDSLLFSEGLAGIIWGLIHLENLKLIENRLDALIQNTNSMFRRFSINNLLTYGLASGTIGYGMYYLAKIDRDQEIDKYRFEIESLESILINIENLLPYINDQKFKSLNHCLEEGPFSILPFLMKLIKANIHRNLAKDLVGKVTDLMLRKHTDGFNSFFVDYYEIKEIDLCYLNLLFAYSLVRIRSTPSVPNLQELGEKIALKQIDLQFRSSEYDFYDIPRYAFVAHLFNRLFQSTGKESFKSNALRICKEVSALTNNLIQKDGMIIAPDLCGLANGLAGVGLILMGVCTKRQPSWDESLLIS